MLGSVGVEEDMAGAVALVTSECFFTQIVGHIMSAEGRFLLAVWICTVHLIDDIIHRSVARFLSIKALVTPEPACTEQLLEQMLLLLFNCIFVR